MEEDDDDVDDDDDEVGDDGRFILNGHGSNSGITEWWTMSDVKLGNSLVNPCFNEFELLEFLFFF